MLVHHFSHYCSRRCRRMMSELAGVMNALDKHTPVHAYYQLKRRIQNQILCARLIICEVVCMSEIMVAWGSWPFMWTRPLWMKGLLVKRSRPIWRSVCSNSSPFDWFGVSIAILGLKWIVISSSYFRLANGWVAPWIPSQVWWSHGVKDSFK